MTYWLISTLAAPILCVKSLRKHYRPLCANLDLSFMQYYSYYTLKYRDTLEVGWFVQKTWMLWQKLVSRALGKWSIMHTLQHYRRNVTSYTLDVQRICMWCNIQTPPHTPSHRTHRALVFWGNTLLHSITKWPIIVIFLVFIHQCKQIYKMCFSKYKGSSVQQCTCSWNADRLLLTFISPCISNMLAEYNQQDATFHNLFISVRHSTCFWNM